MPSSFFEKLKKGMGIEGQLEETEEEEIEEKPSKESFQSSMGQTRKKRGPKPKKLEAEIKPMKTQVKKLELETPGMKKGEIKEEKVEIIFDKEELPEKIAPIIQEAPVEENKPSSEDKPSFAHTFAKTPADEETTEGKEKWSPLGGEPEGELAIDVYQTETNLIIQTAIAGVKPENLDISMERDIIAIKGTRQKPFEEEGDYFTQECFWGLFSREIILPVEVDPDRAEATMKDGILTIRIPKILREKKRVIKVRI